MPYTIKSLGQDRRLCMKEADFDQWMAAEATWPLCPCYVGINSSFDCRCVLHHLPILQRDNPSKMASQDELKKQTGYKAVDDYVKSGMVVGLGTGSTAYFAVERLGQLLKSGKLKDVVAIPTSVRTKEQAESLGIPLVTLDTHSKLDVAIDGADNVDPDFNLVKGGGGALLREKMVELSAEKFIVIGE